MYPDFCSLLAMSWYNTYSYAAFLGLSNKFLSYFLSLSLFGNFVSYEKLKYHISKIVIVCCNYLH